MALVSPCAARTVLIFNCVVFSNHVFENVRFLCSCRVVGDDLNLEMHGPAVSRSRYGCKIKKDILKTNSFFEQLRFVEEQLRYFEDQFIFLRRTVLFFFSENRSACLFLMNAFVFFC